MPHLTVKMMAGKTEEQKQAIADALVKAMMETAGSSEAALSVSIVDIERDDWGPNVYRPEIAPQMDALYKKPGYDPM